MSRRSKATSSSSSSPSSPDTKANSNSQTALLTNPSAETGHLSTVRALNLADYITLLNGFSGTMSVLSSMRYCLNSVPPPSSPIGSAASAAAAAAAASDFSALWVALAFMPAGLLADFMDGKVARWRGKGEGSLLGQELDSLADLISFGLAPASAAFALGFRTPLDTLVLTFFVLCGLTRLARFNVTVASIPKDASGKSKYFEGLPIPTSLTMVAGMAVALRTGCVLDKLPLGVWAQGSLLEVHPLVGVFVLWGCFMLSRSLKVPKP